MDAVLEEDEASTMESALRGSTRITINKKLVTEQQIVNPQENI